MDKNLWGVPKDFPLAGIGLRLISTLFNKFYCNDEESQKELQIRELLAEYYRMVPGPQELVSDFAHRFCDVQTELTKLIPGIHRTPKGRRRYRTSIRFCIKTSQNLQSEIISREFTYNCLREVIQIAERYEEIHLLTVAGWKLDALISIV